MMLIARARTDKKSLSARRAWIEISPVADAAPCQPVALRKESVDRNLRLVFAR